MSGLKFIDIPELTDDGIFMYQGPHLDFLCRDINRIITSDDIINIITEHNTISIYVYPYQELIIIATSKYNYTYVIKSPRVLTIFKLIKESINKSTNSLFIPDFRFNSEIHDKIGDFYVKSGLIYKYDGFDIKVSNILHIDNTESLHKVVDNLGKPALIGREVYNLSYEVIETIETQKTKILINNMLYPYIYVLEA